MDNLINKTAKKLELLKELKESLIYEKCQYAIDKQPDRAGRFFLIHIGTKEILKDGTPDRIKAYLNLRKIKEETIYNFKLLE